jgi:hypothetical protein
MSWESLENITLWTGLINLDLRQVKGVRYLPPEGFRRAEGHLLHNLCENSTRGLVEVQVQT